MTSKKDYQKAVEIVRTTPRTECGCHRIEVEDAFVELFKDNPRFDVKRFRQACNGEY